MFHFFGSACTLLIRENLKRIEFKEIDINECSYCFDFVWYNFCEREILKIVKFKQINIRKECSFLCAAIIVLIKMY